MDSAILWLLGAAGVLTIGLFVTKGLLDQLPDLFTSWHRAKQAYRGVDTVSSTDPDSAASTADGDEEHP